MADVLVFLASKSDREVGEKALQVLREFGVSHEVVVASAHRTPDRVRSIVQGSDAKVILAFAGLSAALPGAIAAHTTRPVIGVPVSGKVNLDAILAIVQMPPGIPVAGVGLDRGENAALLAVQILALSDPALGAKLRDHRKKLEAGIVADSEALGKA